ncbi:hypothetical protein ONZ45_g10792 [Pleurotus djamor]|nr:hypothetical protein ONZ45_g10792 [Pleurotus djamor]
MLNQDPSENWDDDFEFATTAAQQRRANSIDAGAPPRHSIASSRFTEDWDDPRHANNNYEHKRGSVILEDKLNVAGPSTPTKRTLPKQTHREQETENWDDDFELDSNSPARKSTPRKPPITPSRMVQHPLDAGPRRKTPRKRPTRPPNAPMTENWDDDFELEDSDDEDAEFGFHGEEEDRTVTARSRRGGLARMPSPPPPVPPLPNLSLNTLNSNYHTSNIEQPFPRSPTTSVFSVPATTTSGRDSVAGHSYHTTNSQTHLSLGPSVSRTSAARTGRLSDLPPSPPIHKERERRRLRKKSRPPRLEEGVFELVEQGDTDHLNVNPKRFSGSSSSARASFDSQRSSDLDGSAGIHRASPLRLSEVPEGETSRAGSSRDHPSLPKEPELDNGGRGRALRQVRWWSTKMEQSPISTMIHLVPLAPQARYHTRLPNRLHFHLHLNLFL